MKKILFCIYTHNLWGGIELWARRLALDLSANGWDVTFGLARGRRFNDPAAFRRANPEFPTVELDGRTGTPEGRILAVRRGLEAARPDIVVPLGLGDVLPAVGRSKRRGNSVRLVLPLHAINAGLFSDVRAFAPILDLCAAVNPLQGAFLSEWTSLPAERFETILHGSPLPTKDREPTDTGSGPLRILFAGRLHQQSKRVLDAVPLARELDRRGVPFELTFAGSGESEPELRRALRDSGLESRIRYLGFVSPDVLHREVYPGSDVLVVFSPPTGEAAVLTILEALAHGVVPVTTEFIGIHSLGYVVDGATACLYPCGATDAAADAIETLGKDTELRRRMSTAGQAAVRGLTVEESNRRWRGAFDRVLALPVRGQGREARGPLLEPRRGAGRLEKSLSPASADRVRRALRLWPDFSDGWAEWPGTLTAPEPEEERKMWERLSVLDRAVLRAGEPVAIS